MTLLAHPSNGLPLSLVVGLPTWAWQLCCADFWWERWIWEFSSKLWISVNVLSFSLSAISKNRRSWSSLPIFQDIEVTSHRNVNVELYVHFCETWSVQPCVFSERSHLWTILGHRWLFMLLMCFKRCTISIHLKFFTFNQSNSICMAATRAKVCTHTKGSLDSVL